MKKAVLTNIGGIIIFYLVIVLGVLLLNLRFETLNNKEVDTNIDNYVAINY